MAQGHVVQEVTNQEVLHFACQRRSTAAQPKGIAYLGDGLKEIAPAGRLREVFLSDCSILTDGA